MSFSKDFSANPFGAFAASLTPEQLAQLREALGFPGTAASAASSSVASSNVDEVASVDVVPERSPTDKFPCSECKQALHPNGLNSHWNIVSCLTAAAKL